MHARLWARPAPGVSCALYAEGAIAKLGRLSASENVTAYRDVMTKGGNARELQITTEN